MEAKGKARRYRRVLRDTIQGLTKPAYKRLFFISYANPKPPAGTKEFPRFGKYLLEQSRSETVAMINNIMKAAGEMLLYEKKTIIQVSTLKMALSFLGETLYPIDGDDELVLTKSIDGVKECLKKNKPFLVFPRSAMNRFFREIIQDIDLGYEKGVRKEAKISKVAALNLQLFFESKMIELYRKAIRVARHAKRLTVVDKDMQFSRAMCTSRVMEY